MCSILGTVMAKYTDETLHNFSFKKTKQHHSPPAPKKKKKKSNEKEGKTQNINYWHIAEGTSFF